MTKTNKKYKIINKIIHSDYVKFELDGYIEFINNERKNFICCVNKYPFAGYRIGEEIEVELTSLKRMNAYTCIDDQKEIVKKTNYYDYGVIQDQSENSNEELKSPQFSSLGLIQLTNHQMKLTLNVLYNTIYSLEEYGDKVEKSGHY